MPQHILAHLGDSLPLFDNRQSWYGQEMARRTDWLHTLLPAECAEIKSAVKEAISGGVSLIGLRPQDFPLPSLAPRLAAIGESIKRGCGFALLRGLDSQTMTLQEQAYAFCGIGCYLGDAVSQNAKGHVLGHVANLGLDYADPHTRGYQTSSELRFHTDGGDIVGLACIRPARSGGLSRIASSTTVWNEMVRRRPDLALELRKPYSFTRWGEVRPGQRAYADITLFQECAGRMISVFIAGAIEKAQALAGVRPLSDAGREAIQMVNDLAGEDGIRLDMEFRPGDIQFLLNHSTLHSRTAYEDWPEPERRRHLLRLWLACADGPELPEEITTSFQGRTAAGRPDGIQIPGVALRANWNIE